MSVLDNVMLPLAYTDVPRREREMRAVHALRSVGLPVDHYDHRTNELSGGQMQRVAIARALVNDPAIILADEPTGNLDSVTGRQVMDTFHALKRAGKTIVLITHDASVAAEADRAIQIRDGRVYEGAYVPAAAAAGVARVTATDIAAGHALRSRRRPIINYEPGRCPMSFTDLCREAFRSLEANKGRSLLTILGIVIGIAAGHCHDIAHRRRAQRPHQRHGPQCRAHRPHQLRRAAL